VTTENPRKIVDQKSLNPSRHAVEGVAVATAEAAELEVADTVGIVDPPVDDDCEGT
jgi:hypothetical protein